MRKSAFIKLTQGFTKRFFCAVIASLMLASCFDSSVGSDSATSHETSEKLSPYSKDGLNLELPDGWDVVDDVQSETVRTLLAVAENGSMLSIDIYRESPSDTLLTPPINEYFKRYVMATMPMQETQDSAKITYGTVDRQIGTGLYAEINASYPDVMNIFVETLRYQEQRFVVYFTFQSSLSEASSTANQIDLITTKFRIEDTTKPK